jgi:small-conductance mechanosensitive channel
MLMMEPQRRNKSLWEKRSRRWTLLAICCGVMSLLVAVRPSADPSVPDSGAPVRINGQTLFTIHTGLADIDPASRAQAIEKRLARLLQAPASVIQSITVEDHEQTSYIVTSNEVLFVVTENEAKAVGQPRRLLADEQPRKIREVLLASLGRQVPLEPAPAVGLRDLLWAGVATALLIFFAVLVRVFSPRLNEALEAWRGTRLRAVSVRGLELISADHLTDGLLFLSKLLWGTLAVLALYFYLHFVLALFPRSRELEHRFLETLAAPLDQMKALRTNWGDLFIGLLLVLIASGIFLGLLKVFRQLFPHALNAVSRWGRTTRYSFKIQRVELLSGSQVAEGVLGLVRALRVVAYASLIYLYTTSILGFFPATRKLSVELLGYMVEPLKMIGLTFVTSLPDVIAIAMIVLVTRYIIKLIHMLFTGIERGAITFEGFHREWANSTYRIVRFLVLVLAAVAIFPYIPGSHSEAFRGISVFLGILISLGAAGAFSNIVAGVILTYMRPFTVGDRVKIADTVGDITEKTLLVTRVRTIKNVDITIPNALVLGTHIVNYSSSGIKPPPLIIHTTVTIGYDTQWRTVHDLLKRAAAATKNVLIDPEPFVMQTSLNDFYVTYEVNAFTGAPNKMAETYSELHQNIQDLFNDAGVEIMSPHYTQLRDGSRTAIPEQYLPKHSQAPGLRIWPLGSSQQRPEAPSSGKGTSTS